MSKTIGEQRVRTEFNPSSDSVVDQIKQKTAKIINLCETVKTGESEHIYADIKDTTAEIIPICHKMQTKDRRLADLAIEAYLAANEQAQNYELEDAQTNFELAAMWAVKLATA